MIEENAPGYIPPTARLFWMAHHFRISRTYQDRYELECLDGYEYARTLPCSNVSELKLSGDLVIEPFYFDIDGKPAKSGSTIGMLASASPGDVRAAMVAITKARIFDRAHTQGITSLGETQPPPKSGKRRRRKYAMTADVWLHQSHAQLHAACMPFYILDPKAPRGHEKPRLGQFGLPSLGSVSTLKKDRQKLKRKGWKVTDFLPKKDAMRNGGRKMPADMVAFLRKQIASVMLRRERMLLAQFRRHASAELRKVPEMAGRRIPSTEAIQKLIDGLDNALVVAARFEIKKAVESHTIYTEGPEYLYPGELVLMDCWKIDLVAKLDGQGGWIFVNDHEIKEEWGVKRRLWVSWVIDACSRAILGIALGLSESSDLTCKALRMSVSDKTLYCLDAGCEAKPIPPIGFDGLLTDIGPAFKSPHFQVAALSLVPDADIGPADSAHLRGTLERFNRRVKDQLLAYFTGTTFGNVIAKGDYDSLERASADVQDLGRGLWLWVNDVYNLSEHRGLDDQPVIDRFEERYNSKGGHHPYSEDEIRVALGLDFKIPLTRQGICFASNHYIAASLQDYVKRNGFKHSGKTRKIRVKIDPANLGRISAFFEGEWHTLAGPARMRNVGLTNWLDERKALSLRYRGQAAVHAEVIAKALLKLERMGTEARMRAQVIDWSYDSAAVKSAVKRIRLRIKEQATPTQDGQLLAFDTDSDEASFSTSGFDQNDELEIPDDPYADADDNVRPETDQGLDNADIDQDGDLLDDAPGPPLVEDAAKSPSPRVERRPSASQPPAAPLSFLPPPPKRK